MGPATLGKFTLGLYTWFAWIHPMDGFCFNELIMFHAVTVCLVVTRNRSSVECVVYIVL